MSRRYSRRPGAALADGADPAKALRARIRATGRTATAASSGLTLMSDRGAGPRTPRPCGHSCRCGSARRTSPAPADGGLPDRTPSGPGPPLMQLAQQMPERWQAFVPVKTFASLRWGEITALRRRDFGRATGVISIRAAYTERSDGTIELGAPNSRAGVRSIALPIPVVHILEQHLEEFVGSDEDSLVFCGPSGRPIRRSNSTRPGAGRPPSPRSVCLTYICTIDGTLATPWRPALRARRHATDGKDGPRNDARRPHLSARHTRRRSPDRGRPRG